VGRGSLSSTHVFDGLRDLLAILACGALRRSGSSGASSVVWGLQLATATFGSGRGGCDPLCRASQAFRVTLRENQALTTAARLPSRWFAR